MLHFLPPSHSIFPADPLSREIYKHANSHLSSKKNGRFAELEALVDTGATFTKIPKSIASKLGLQAKYATDVELGDKRIIRRELALGEVEIEDVRRPVLIAIGGDDERPLIGYTTLELLGFKINPITGKLEKTYAIEY